LFFLRKKIRKPSGFGKIFPRAEVSFAEKTPGFDVNKREVIGKKWEDCFPRVPQIYPADSVAK